MSKRTEPNRTEPNRTEPNRPIVRYAPHGVSQFLPRCPMQHGLIYPHRLLA
ncbi:MAG: hypothetical protein JXK51_03740 [Halothiobacillaceae bacterium]|nr:hypothetical protein [Halothiobacillaceae bacterium]